VARQPPWKRLLFHRALALGVRRAEGRLSWVEQAQWLVLERLVLRQVRARFGGRFRAAMSGGARLEPEVGRFFLGIGIALMQGYGQTEAGPVISANPPGRARIETVGPPLRGVDLRIAPDGEILVRGDLVMDGYLRITDRKKDMIVLSGGDNVSPARIEGMLIAEPAIAQAVVLGEGAAGVGALLVPADGFDEVSVAAAVAAVNKRLSVTERIRRHAVVPPFTVENGLLTATQKIRRHQVTQVFAEAAAGLLR
jgi:long-chain acyl-CoA synthetase